MGRGRDANSDNGNGNDNVRFIIEDIIVDTLKQPTDNLLAKTVGDNKASAERAMIKFPKLVLKIYLG